MFFPGQKNEKNHSSILTPNPEADSFSSASKKEEKESHVPGVPPNDTHGARCGEKAFGNAVPGKKSLPKILGDDVSDVHITREGYGEDEERKFIARARTNGILGAPTELFLDGEWAETSAAISSPPKKDFALSLPDGRRLRVAARTGLSGDVDEVFLRVLPMEIPPAWESVARLLPELVKPFVGLVLVSGVTGSGKSTLLASIAERHILSGSHVVTVEDPVEYMLRPAGAGYASQREVGADVENFAAGVKMSLREDPDTIVIGEVRDPDTASAALSAAETGHAVLATVHAGGCFGAVDRFLSLLGPGDYQAMRLSASFLCGIHASSAPSSDGRRVMRTYEVFKSNDAARTHIRDRATHRLGQARSGLMEHEYRVTV